MTISNDGELSSMMFDREVGIEDIEKLSKVREYGPDFALHAYAMLRSSTRCLEYSDELYELYIAIFFQIISTASVKDKVVRDVGRIEMNNIAKIGLTNALLEILICRVEKGDSIYMYEGFVEEMCERMTNSFFQSIFMRDPEDPAMDIKLDFMILSLKLIVMLVEKKARMKKEISKKYMFKFAKEYFYESLVLFNQDTGLENDVVFVFKTVFAIDALVTERITSRVNEVFCITGDLPITEENLFKIYVQIAKVSRYSSDGFNDLLFLVFTTNCLISLGLSYRSKFIDTLLVMIEPSSSEPTVMVRPENATETFRKIFHNLRDSESEDKDALVWNFLSFLSRLKLVKDVGDINNIFLKFVVKHPGTVELYSDFILLNGIDVPLHSLHQASNFSFMQRFYSILFNKVRREKHSISHVDRLIVEFLKFFLATKNKELIGILPLVPYIPTKRETLHALYEIYAFLFEKDSIDYVGLFLLKTPALVGISSSIYYNVKYFPDLATKLNLMNVDAQRLVFLGIVYSCESKKIHNFNYTGILEYIEDEDTIRTSREGLIRVVELIHSNYMSRSYEFALSYVNSLLSIALKPRTTETTLIIIEIVLRKVLEKEEKIIFIKEIHQRFQELFILFRKKKFLGAEVIDSYVSLYKGILERIRCASNFYNYVVLCLADLSFFDGEFQKNQFKSFNDLYSHTLSRMRVIEEFPDIFMVDYEWDSSGNLGESMNSLDIASDDANLEGSCLGLRNDLDSGGVQSGGSRAIAKDGGKGPNVRKLKLAKWGEFGLVPRLTERDTEESDRVSHDMYSIIHTGVNESMMSLAPSTGSISLRSSANTTACLDNIDINLLNKGIRRREKSVSWLIDIIYTRRSQSSTIRTVLDLLKLRLENMFEYEDLYILLKAYNILAIRENDSERFLKQALHKGLDFKTDPVICHKLASETGGFYKFFFRTLHFAVSDSASAENPSFPEKNQLVSKFSTVDLILIQNTFKQKVTYKILSRSGIASYRSYFFNVEELDIVDCLTIIKRLEDPFIVSKALEKLKTFGSEVFFYVPQLVQALRHDGILEMVLITLKSLARDGVVSHQLIWNLKANLYKDENKKVKDENYTVFKHCIEEIMNEMSEENRLLFLREEEFVRSLTNISLSLLPYLGFSKDEKRRRINEHLLKVSIHPDIYVPYNPEQKILEVISGSARVLQSHAKVPFMASFKVQDANGQTNIKQLIFKFGDDCRQDMLALQLISMFRSIFKQANLDIFLYPYRVIATEAGCGIIEVIPNSKSRDQIGRENINNLSEYFEYKFGFKESEGYLTALYNFASSLAGYSLVVYFLNIKDRHNGNIMIDDKGRMIHIDFGYMLETSPGNLNIEAPLKLTKEIEELLGGTSGKGFRIYQDLMVKGFLALRRRSKELVMMMDSFVESKLSCYKDNAVENFILRFRFELSDKNARTFILSLIAESSQKFRTWMYDQYQKLTNNISF